MVKNLFRKSFISISLVGIGTVFNAALGFLFLSAIAKALPISDFGRYALLSSLLLSVTKILDFGTNSIYVANENADDSVTNTFLSNKIVQFLIALPISLIILFALKLTSWEVILFFLLGIVSYGIYYSLFGLFQKEENYLMLVLMAAIPALIKGLVATLILMGVIRWGFVHYFGIFSLSVGTSFLFILFVPETIKQFRWNFSKAISDLKTAFSPGISQLITESFSAVSNTLTKFALGFADVGIFSIADKISGAFVLVSFSIFTVLLPKNAARKKEHKSYDYTETIILTIGVILLSFVAVLASQILVPWFFENKYNNSLDILSILVFSGAASAIHAFMENYFYVEKKTKILGIVSIAKLAIFILLSGILIPFLALRGLAYAHLASSVIILGSVLFLVFKDQQKAPSDL